MSIESPAGETDDPGVVAGDGGSAAGAGAGDEDGGLGGGM